MVGRYTKKPQVSTQGVASALAGGITFSTFPFLSQCYPYYVLAITHQIVQYNACGHHEGWLSLVQEGHI